MSLYKITESGSAWGPILSLQKTEVWRLGVAAQSHSPSAWVTNLAGLPGTEGMAGMRNFRAEAGTVPGNPGLEAGDPALPQSICLSGG